MLINEKYEEKVVEGRLWREEQEGRREGEVENN